MTRTSILVASAILFLALGAQAAGWKNNAACGGANVDQLGAGQDVFFCLTDTTQSGVLDVLSFAEGTLYATTAKIVIQRCADPAGTKCADIWEANATSCNSTAASACNTIDLKRGWYKATASGVEAGALFGLRGMK